MVSVPALHDAMGISIETVDPAGEDEERENQQQEQEQVDSTQTTTMTTSSLTSSNEIEHSNQQ